MNRIALILIALLPSVSEAGGRYFRSCYTCAQPVVHATYQPQQVQHKFDPQITINNVIGQQPLLGDTAYATYPSSYPNVDPQALKTLELERKARALQSLAVTVESLSKSDSGIDALLLQTARDNGDVARLRAQTELLRAAQRKEGVVEHQTSAGSYIQTEVTIDGVKQTQPQIGGGKDAVPLALEVVQNRCANCHTAAEPKGGISYEGIERLTPKQWGKIIQVTLVQRTMPKDQTLLPQEIAAMSEKMADPEVAIELGAFLRGEQ